MSGSLDACRCQKRRCEKQRKEGEEKGSARSAAPVCSQWNREVDKTARNGVSRNQHHLTVSDDDFVNRPTSLLRHKQDNPEWRERAIRAGGGGA